LRRGRDIGTVRCWGEVRFLSLGWGGYSILDFTSFLDILFFGTDILRFFWFHWYISEAVDLLRYKYGGGRINRKARTC
jgi:hypothetical protein